jgi:hypothetical protein
VSPSGNRQRWLNELLVNPRPTLLNLRDPIANAIMNGEAFDPFGMNSDSEGDIFYEVPVSNGTTY